MAYNILLVDDSATTRAVVAKLLHLAKIPLNNLLEASNGKEALQILDRHWVDLIMADINMPVMNGIEMIEAIAEDSSLDAIPVVVVSTEGSVTLIEHLKTRGVRAWIRKPFTPELIRNVVNDTLGLEESAHTNIHDGNDRRAVICRVFSDVLEKAAFMFADATPADDLKLPPDECICVTIGFAGVCSGELQLMVPRRISLEMAANVLGLNVDDSVVEERAEDAIKEVLSVTCGNMLTALAGVTSVFELLKAEIRSITQLEWLEVKGDSASMAFYIDDRPALMRVVFAGAGD